jgi:hypothetical protein
MYFVVNCVYGDSSQQVVCSDLPTVRGVGC